MAPKVVGSSPILHPERSAKAGLFLYTYVYVGLDPPGRSAALRGAVNWEYGAIEKVGGAHTLLHF